MEARAAVDRAVRLAREHDDVESLGWAHTQYALLDYFGGESATGSRKRARARASPSGPAAPSRARSPTA